jgi:hypothetical protein
VEHRGAIWQCDHWLRSYGWKAHTLMGFNGDFMVSHCNLMVWCGMQRLYTYTYIYIHIFIYLSGEYVWPFVCFCMHIGIYVLHIHTVHVYNYLISSQFGVEQTNQICQSHWECVHCMVISSWLMITWKIFNSWFHIVLPSCFRCLHHLEWCKITPLPVESSPTTTKDCNLLRGKSITLLLESCKTKLHL